MFRARGWRYVERGTAVPLVGGVSLTGLSALQGAPGPVTASAAAVSAVCFGLLAVVVAFDRLRIRAEANELRARLERALAEDPETGLSSISRFRRDAAVAMARFKRRRERFSLVIFRLPIDLDLVSREPNLRDLARALAINLRQEDTLARVGDRELAALLPGSGADAAENFLLRTDPAVVAHRGRAGMKEWSRDLATLDDLLRLAREDLNRRIVPIPIRAAS